MEFEELFEKAVKGANKKGVRRFPIMMQTVTEVSETTCTTADGIDDIRLNAIDADLDSKITIYPKIGSKIIYGRLNDTDDLFVLKYSEIDRIVIKMDKQIFEMKDGKFRILNAETNLKTVLNDLFSTLENAIIQTPSGAGKFIDLNKQKYKSLNQQIDKLLF
ncbi:hypothetical protein [Empedobacter sp. GD03797]|uniref:hypothetical protein n=1 Tax=Empedobacter sp. GD03797 TaxID=2975382 RepID=UPI002448BBFE|nr:hypothetical protein [Empedobacter sp. GD03797]MDH1883966.1 hypothetical protein [Empedobacter sp. GD03797]